MRLAWFGIFLATSALGALPDEGNISLHAAIQRALENNHEVLRAARGLQAAQAKLSSARSQFFPKLDLSLDAGTFHDRVPQPGDSVVPLISRERNAYNAQLTVTQNLFSGFQHSSAVQR